MITYNQSFLAKWESKSVIWLLDFRIDYCYHIGPANFNLGISWYSFTSTILTLDSTHSLHYIILTIYCIQLLQYTVYSFYIIKFLQYTLYNSYNIQYTAFTLYNFDIIHYTIFTLYFFQRSLSRSRYNPAWAFAGAVGRQGASVGRSCPPLLQKGKSPSRDFHYYRGWRLVDILMICWLIGD